MAVVCIVNDRIVMYDLRRDLRESFLIKCILVQKDVFELAAAGERVFSYSGNAVRDLNGLHVLTA